jgi:hypothetical protein
MSVYGSKLIHKEKYFDGNLFTASTFLLDAKVEELRIVAQSKMGYSYEPWKIHIFIQSWEVASNVEGDYVELGTGKGFLSFIAANSHPSPKQFHLFDKFDNRVVDKVSGAMQKHTNGSYADSLWESQLNFVKNSNVKLYKGLLPESLRTFNRRICFLHIDLNASEPETKSLRMIYPLISRGGIIVLDDYSQQGRKPQYDGMNLLASELGFKIINLPTGQGLILL